MKTNTTQIDNLNAIADKCASEILNTAKTKHGAVGHLQISAIIVEALTKISEQTMTHNAERRALSIINLSQRDCFQDDFIWALWCRSVSNAGLLHDEKLLSHLDLKLSRNNKRVTP